MQRFKHSIRRLFSILLISILCVGLFPIASESVLAADSNTQTVTITSGKLYDCCSLFHLDSTKKYTYSTLNKSSIAIVGNQILGLDKGTAKVKVQEKKSTKVSTYTVKVSYPSYYNTSLKLNTTNVTLLEGQSFKLKSTGCNSKISYTSKSKKIATVSSTGLIKAIKDGSTVITAKTADASTLCVVTVMPKEAQSELLDFTAPSSATYYQNWTIKPKKEYILAIHPGTYLPKDFEKKFGKLVALVEEEYGYKLVPEKGVLMPYDTNKLVVIVGDYDFTSYNSSYLCINSALLNLYNQSAIQVAKELVLALMSRNNCSNCLTNRTLCDRIARQALDGSGYVSKNCILFPDKINSWEEPSNITVTKIKKELLNFMNGQSLSDYLGQYIIEKYGMKRLKTILNAMDKAQKKNGSIYADSIIYSDKKALDLCIKYTSKNLLSDYAKWLKKKLYVSHGPLEDLVQYHASPNEKIKVTPGEMFVSENANLYVTDFDGAITYDFTEMMRYLSVYRNTKVTGIYGFDFVLSSDNTYKVYYYDKNNKLITKFKTNGSVTVSQDGVVKVKIVGKGTISYMTYYTMSNYNKYVTTTEEIYW